MTLPERTLVGLGQDQFQPSFDDHAACTYVVDCDEPGLFTAASTGIEELTGYPVDRLESGVVGLTQLVLDEDADLLARELHRAAITGAPYEITYRIRQLDGSLRWLLDRGQITLEADGCPASRSGILVDVTTQKEAEAARTTERDLARLAVQANQGRLASVIATQREAAMGRKMLDETLRSIVDNAAAITNADGAALLLLDQDELVVRSACGVMEPALEARIDPAHGVLATWLQDALPRRFADVQARVETALVVAGIEDAHGLVLAPVRHEQRVVGFLEVVARESGVFLPHDEQTLELLSVVATAALAQDELQQHAERSEYQAMHDSLTGLPNRVLFHDRIHQALLTAEREHGRVAVLLLDLDRFKEINDTLGHASGDHVLREVATRLNGCLRASDTVARLGGDEFGLLLPKQNDAAEVARLLDKLTAAIEEPVDLDGLPLGIGGSIGVALYPDDALTGEELVKRADVAMYVAKQDNRPYAFYDVASDSNDTSRLTLVGEVRRALDNHELVLHYQPKAALADGSVSSVEALVRWEHPERGLVQPDDFIPAIEQTGLMKPLALYVIDEALRQVALWRQDGLELAVAVNMGTRNLIDLAFPDDVAAALEKWELDASCLQLELTESTMLEDPVRTKVVLDRLDAMGVRLSIDDFGTGYSSLAYLRDLPVRELKIDRSFVMNMDVDGNDAVIVRLAIDLGRNLGLDVVAEGVETAEAWEQLSGMGCKLAQGYLLSRPVPADELAAWVRNANL